MGQQDKHARIRTATMTVKTFDPAAGLFRRALKLSNELDCPWHHSDVVVCAQRGLAEALKKAEESKVRAAGVFAKQTFLELHLDTRERDEDNNAAFFGKRRQQPASSPKGWVHGVFEGQVKNGWEEIDIGVCPLTSDELAAAGLTKHGPVVVHIEASDRHARSPSAQGLSWDVNMTLDVRNNQYHGSVRLPPRGAFVVSVTMLRGAVTPHGSGGGSLHLGESPFHISTR